VEAERDEGAGAGDPSNAGLRQRLERDADVSGGRGREGDGGEDECEERAHDVLSNAARRSIFPP
jgi:hypothetical protein